MLGREGGREGGGAKDPPPPLNLPLHVSIFTASRVSFTGQPQTRIVSMVTSRAHAQQGRLVYFST